MKNVCDDEGRIKEAFRSIGQGHIFRFWEDLNTKQRECLLNQIRGISVQETQSAWKDMHKDKLKISQPESPKFVSAINPLNPELSNFREIGESELRHNRVAAFTVAGGQGTRLGHSGPKGTYPCTPLKKTSLFEHFAKGIKFFSSYSGKAPWWFIMTSKENHQETINFFARMNFFGLESKRVKFFQQGMMPVYDLQGKILLKEKHEIVMSPNGHGGSFRGLLESGALRIMEEEGIDHISYFQVDNPMVYCLDPTFIGLHLAEKSEMSSKAVEKINANERVGTFIRQGDKLHVIEYSDIPREISELRNSDESLCFRLGSIAIHLLNRKFVQRVAGASQLDEGRLNYHGALKAVNYLDDDGSYIEAQSPNALKAETFVFDALPLARNPLIVEIDRGEEFAPIKNAHGTDSLESSQKLQTARARKWLQGELQHIPEKVEIAPSFAPTRPHFVEKISNYRKEIKFTSTQALILEESGPFVQQF